MDNPFLFCLFSFERIYSNGAATNLGIHCFQAFLSDYFE